MASLLTKFRFSYYFVILILSLVILPAGCGDITDGVGGIVISPSPAIIGVNQTQFFTALGRDASGKLIAISPTWSVSGNIGSITSSGLFTAGAVDATGSVIATADSLSGSAAVTVTTTGWLGGIVSYSNGTLVSGIRVYLKEIPTYGDGTDSAGKCLISYIPPGTYEADIDASAHGNTEAASAEVTIVIGQTTTQNFVLSTPTTTVPPTTTL